MGDSVPLLHVSVSVLTGELSVYPLAVPSVHVCELVMISMHVPRVDPTGSEAVDGALHGARKVGI